MTESPAPEADAQDRPRPEAQEQEPSATLALVAAKLSDVGRMRPHNEDYVDYHIPQDPHQLAQKGSIFLVADGMGGHRAGEVASQGAVEKVISRYYSDASHDVPSSLVGAFRTANQQLHAQAQGDPGKAGMGTTLVAAVILGQKVYVANVGDSRAYLIRDQGITQITEDHSWVGEQVRAGLLTEEQARRHPQRNLVTRALASKASVDVDLFEGEISPGDSILLCTDGLTGRVQDAEIAAAVQQHAPEEAARRLVAQANERGGNDNITVLIVTADEAIRATRAAALAPSGQPQRGFLILALISLILAGLAVGAYLGTQWWLAPGNTPAARGTEMSPATAASPFAGETIPAQTAAATDGTPPGETPLPPTSTLAAPGPTATSGAAISPPTLVQPQEGDLLHGMVTFTWDHSLDELDPGHAFQVLIWSGDPNEANPPGAGELTGSLSQQINLDTTIAADRSPGQYFWSVVVVDESNGERLSRQPVPRTFIYPGPSDTATPSSSQASPGRIRDHQWGPQGDPAPTRAARNRSHDPYL